MSIKTIHVTSGNITLSPATMDELEAFNAIHQEAVSFFSFDPDHTITTPYDCLTVGDLPPNGSREHFHTISIYVDGDLAGYATVYLGYPEKKAAYLSFIYIVDSLRSKGIGKRVVGMLCEYFSQHGYASMHISVSLRNWDAIAFWYHCGFDTLSLVAVDENYRTGGYGCIELCKSLERAA
ncbi:GNAT family N-acetyltransferase [Eubacteriales bacterium OttesenSCG-928-N14]|nr:GNAT family N-acetyltransferase [Eubacteriales bacterium OttesenSCG-928-N14]